MIPAHARAYSAQSLGLFENSFQLSDCEGRLRKTAHEDAGQLLAPLRFEIFLKYFRTLLKIGWKT